MTALPKYDRLETTGLWRETPDAQRRDVIVSFGDASLVIRSANAPLVHWSLAAVERINPKQRPAIYQPGADSGETLEIEDPDMIAAIEKIRKAIARARPRHGRVRLALLGVAVAAIIALGAWWLPGALINQALVVLPETKRAEIGTALMGHVTRLTGEACETPGGRDALDRLTARVLGDKVSAVHIVSDTDRAAMVLPGRLMLLGRSLVEDHEAPDVLAGYMIASAETAHLPDPIQPLLEFGGARTSFTLLTTGEISAKVLRGYAETLLTRDVPLADDAVLVDRFAQAKVALSPYAYAVDITGEKSVALIEADPYADTPVPRLLPDSDWLNLQAICGG